MDNDRLMKTYRCKHAVEALRWTDTDEDRELFSAWFERHDMMFGTVGPVARIAHDVFILDVKPGEWVVRVDGEFIAMEDTQFHDTYEEIT